MKFTISAWRPQLILELNNGSPILETSDNLEEFLRKVVPYGRFDITAPSNDGQLWHLDFQNDYY